MKNYSDINIFLDTLLNTRDSLLCDTTVRDDWKNIELGILHQQLYELATKYEKKLDNKNNLRLRQIFCICTN